MTDPGFFLLAMTEYSSGRAPSVSRFPTRDWLSARTNCNAKLKAVDATRAQIFLEAVKGEKDTVLVWERFK